MNFLQRQKILFASLTLVLTVCSKTQAQSIISNQSQLFNISGIFNTAKLFMGDISLFALNKIEKVNKIIPNLVQNASSMAIQQAKNVQQSGNIIFQQAKNSSSNAIKQFDKVLGNVVNNIINTFSQYNPANLSCPAFNCPNGSKQIYCVFRYKN